MRLNYYDYFRIRWESIFINVFIVYGIISIDIIKLIILQKLQINDSFFYFLFFSPISFIWALIWEFFYFFTKLISAFLLRLRIFWTYSIPAIIIFFLWILPVFDFTELGFAFRNLEGLQGTIYLTIIGGIVLLATILILVFPVFYGLNGGFVVTSSLFSYVICRIFFVNLSQTFFLWKFFVFYYLFTIILYFYLQVRRRFGIHIVYEKFNYPYWFIILMVILAICLFFCKDIKSISLIEYIFIYIFIFFTVAIVIFSLYIKIEYRKNKRIGKLPFMGILILFPIQTVIFFFSIIHFRPVQREIQHSKRILFPYLIDFSHFAFDQDGDGENILLAHDPDDNHAHIRSEGVFFPRNTNINLPRIKHFPERLNYFFVTIFLPERTNVIHSPFYLSSSNRIELALYSILYRLSSWEVWQLQNQSYHKGESFFSYLTKSYFRTICMGFVDKKKYFSVHNPVRLDKGCEIFSPVSLTKNFRSNPERLKELFWAFRNIYFSYREKRNFVWIHIHDKKLFGINKKELIDFLMKMLPFRKSKLDKNSLDRIIIFLFFKKPFPHYEIYTNISNIDYVLTRKFSYYGTLFRIFLATELPEEKIINESFFLEELAYAKSDDLRRWAFVEPEEASWQEVREIVSKIKKIRLPPISIQFDNNQYRLYDGRLGMVYIGTLQR